MNTAVRASAETFLALCQGVGLSGDQAARAAAQKRFAASGLPSMRLESWRKTNLTAALAPSYALPTNTHARPALPTFDGPCLVMVDGVFRPDLSTLPTAITAARTQLAPVAVDSAMVSLNDMLAADGLQLSVPANIDAGHLLLLSIATGSGDTPTVINSRHKIALAEGARLSLLEMKRGDGVYFSNDVVAVEVGQNAHLTHVRLLQDSVGAVSTATIATEIAERGVYDSFTLTLGGKLTRSEFRARMHGKEAAVHLNGAQLLAGHQVGDITTVVAHDAPNCASRQTIKNVLDEHARGVFQGRIEVARIAQKTDGYQMNQALLLSPDAEIDAKPELQIYADDVKCSHGATVGALDPDQLFYLRARGIPQAEARGLLVRAFIAEALDLVTDTTIRAILDEAVADWWKGHTK